MATKKLTDYFSLTTLPAAGGFQVKTTTPATLIKSKAAPYVPAGPIDPNNSSLGNIASRISINPSGDIVPRNGAPAPAPVVRTPAQGPTPAPAGVGAPSGPIFGSTGASPAGAPVAPQGAIGAAPVSQSPIDPRYVNADGSIKTPDEIAAAIGSTLRAAHGTGDVGTLAGEQFFGGPQTTESAEAQARRVGNARNDLAAGETDPYHIASQSGIAYTPEELSAIEKAYAGIYDPALDTALAKVTERQAADKAAADEANAEKQIRLQGEIDANKPYTLGKDDVRYDSEGNPIAVGLPSDSGGPTGPYVKGANAVVDAYVEGFNNGTYKASDIPDEYKGMVAQGAAATKPTLSKSSVNAISNIDELLNATNLEDITGIRLFDPTSYIPGSAVQVTQNLAKQLDGILKIENRTQLKGSGAISDFEFRVLGDASSALGINDNGRTNLSPEEFKKQLTKLKLKLQVGPTDLTDDELQHLYDSGYTPDQIRSYSQGTAFKTVGNTTASKTSLNRPQRNNNPGNVKEGGSADALAVGKDEQGHLKFPDAATGFKALALDVSAKIAGQSRYLPPNPTIAQLGKVYAEDPGWAKKVAAIVGVPVGTHAGAVPLPNLIKAIATQEGFYA